MKELRIEIDPHRLDEEWTSHPEIVHTQQLKTADAQQEYDTAKSELELCRAELDKEIRDDPGEYGLPTKITEKIVEAAIIRDTEYQDADENVIKKRHALNIHKAAVSALVDRKRALSLLVELFLRDYYSEPTIPTKTELSEEFDKSSVRKRGMQRRKKDRENDTQDEDDDV